MINIKGRVSKIIYYNPQNNWGCLSIEPERTPELEDIFTDTYVTVSGCFQNVYEDCMMSINGEVVKHPKYGNQVQITNYCILIDTNSKESIINWLSKSSIKGINVQNALRIYKKFKEDTINVVLNNPDKLIEVIGIGKITLDKVKSSVHKYKEMEDLIKYCLPLGFTYSLINKISNALGKNALDIIKENIYLVLDHTDSITFKQLDSIAINNGINPEDPNRIKYGFLYTLRNRVMFEGSTGCSMQEIKTEVSKELGIKDVNLFYGALNRLENEGKVCLDNNKVYFKYFYDIEKDIASKVKNLLNNNNEVRIDNKIVEEEINNFPFKLNEQQKEAIYNTLKNNVSIITGAGGCTDEQTEYLTDSGWKYIKDYNGEEIATCDKKKRCIYFEKPEKYHVYPATTWYNLVNSGVDIRVSEEHRIPYISHKKDNLKIRTMKEITEMSTKNIQFLGRFITTFKSDFSREINYSDDYLKLILSFLLKGKFLKLEKEISKINNLELWSLSIHKEDHQIKMEDLLKLNNIEYVKTLNPNNTNFITYECLLKMPSGGFPESWYTISNRQLDIVFKEILYWGKGCRKNSIFSTANEKILDFVQYVATTRGYRSYLWYRGIGESRHVYISDRTLIPFKYNIGKARYKEDIKVTLEEPKEGENKYCFTTSTGLWISRRNGRILVNHNSGKSSLLKAVANIFVRGGYNVELLSPTGKASRRIEECTGRHAQTVHKFLGVKTSVESAEPFTVPKKTVLIIDESSMLDIVLFNKLLDCVNTDTRIILIGDTNQLPSVGSGNVLEDLMTYNKISINVLTDIMRQAKNSTIIKYCSRINEGKLIDECNKDDLYFKSFYDRKDLKEEFSLLFDKEVITNGIDNIQVIIPYKKGDLGVNRMNTYIRNEYNSNELDERYGYKINDRIMHIVNNYAKGVFNGEVGKVITINNEEDYLEVQYDTGNIIYEIDDIDETVLAQAITTHKSQGSEYPVVFVLIDDENSLLLYRKLLYTACSRARKKLYLLCMNNSVDKCILNNYFKVRVSALSNFLKEDN